jgi:broad specificity phosphatase PhoE
LKTSKQTVEIFVARHGQNEDNANGILNGHRDLPLTDIGRQQARELGEGILAAGLKFDAIYSSPLSRALETAQIVSDILDMTNQPIVLDDLIERDFGTMTGQPIEKIEELCSPDILKTDTITYFLNPEGAETFPDLVERASKAVSHIRKQQTSGKVLVVCHGDLGKMLYASVSGAGWEETLRKFHFGNCELIELESNGRTHVIELEQYNS